MPVHFVGLLVETLMFVHIGAGTLALLVGPGAMLGKPKGGTRHKRWGRWYQRSMFVAGVTAFALLVFRPNSFFFALSVFSFYLAFSGGRVLRRKRPHKNAEERARPVDWVAAIATVVVGIGSVALGVLGVFGADTSVVLGALSVAVIAAVYDLWRFIRPAHFAHRPNVWLVEHIVKIGGSYIALACAFTGTVFQQFTAMPVAVAQTWPAWVGAPLLLVVSRRWSVVSSGLGKREPTTDH